MKKTLKIILCLVILVTCFWLYSIFEQTIDIAFCLLRQIIFIIFAFCIPCIAFLKVFSNRGKYFLKRKNANVINIIAVICGLSWLCCLIAVSSCDEGHISNWGLRPYANYFFIPPMLFFIGYTLVWLFSIRPMRLDNISDENVIFWLLNGDVFVLIFIIFISCKIDKIYFDKIDPDHVLILSATIFIPLIAFQTFLYYRRKKIRKTMKVDLVMEVKAGGISFDRLPDNLKTHELCMEAFKDYVDAFTYVPDNLKDREMCLMAVKQDGYLLQYVPDNLKPEVKATLP